MKMQKTGCALLLVSMLTLAGCASAEPSEPAQETTNAETTTSVTAAETTAPAETTAEPEEDYVHGSDGYYCLPDEMPGYKRRYQTAGTCWLHAGGVSMETGYFKENGSIRYINATDLLRLTYLNPKDEGFMVKEGCNGRWVGGWQGIIAATLSRGFDDLTLDSSVILDVNDREAIKENVRNRGGVAIGIVSSDRTKQGLHTDFAPNNCCIKALMTE